MARMGQVKARIRYKTGANDRGQSMRAHGQGKGGGCLDFVLETKQVMDLKYKGQHGLQCIYLEKQSDCCHPTRTASTRARMGRGQLGGSHNNTHQRY